MITQDYNSIWQFDKEVNSNMYTERSMRDTHTFIYENESIIVNMPSVSSVPGIPDDDVYRIKIKWEKNDLYIFPPLGDKWEAFATWDNERFVMYGKDKMKIFKRISPVEIAKWQQSLLKPGRQMWHYKYINPDTVEL